MYMMGGLDHLLQYNPYNGFQNNLGANQIISNSNQDAN